MFGVGVGIRVGGFTPSGGAAPYVGLLDSYPGAAAAYSVRLLKSTYTGSAIRVRRSSDNAESDIGFSGGNLDTSALTSFCGAGNGFVTTWYDQSGNSRNVIQTSATSQPQIVNAGSVINVNSKPCIQFDGVDDKLIVQSLFFTGVSTQFILYDKIGTTGYLGGSFQGSSESPAFLLNANGVFPYQQGPKYGPTYQNNNQALISLKSSTTGTNWEFYGNSIQVTGTENIGIFSTTTQIAFGARGTGTNYGNINMQEYIFYSSDEMTNRVGIETNINSYYGIY